MTRFNFRAWDKKNNVMITTWQTGVINKKTATGEIKEWINHWSNKKYISDLLFMQSTGLEDKDGKMIYEGDIVKMVRREDIDLSVYEEFITDVTFSEGSFGTRNSDKSESPFYFDLYEYEVVGNIYENKGLLKS